MSELIGLRLPRQLVIKGVININREEYFGRVTPYAK